MAYTITPTNGQNPIIVADGTLNTSTTLTLVGKNYPNYGTILDQNLFRLLENSANSTAPSSPVNGEIWWDTTNRILKVWVGSAWKPIGGVVSTAAGTPPASNNNVGDLWWDSTPGNSALWAYDGTLQAYKKIGPIGGTADISSEVLSDGSSSHNVISFKLSGTRYMIFSTDATFSPSPAISGFQSISPGLNLASSTFLVNAKFVGQASDSVTVGGIAPASFVRSDQNTSTTGTLSVLNNNGLFVGTAQNLNLSAATPDVSITDQVNGGTMRLEVHDSGGNLIDALDILPNGNVLCNFDLVIAGSIKSGGSGDFLITSTTASTNPTTGAFQDRGGAGISGNLNVGGTQNYFSGTVTAQNITSNSSITAGSTVTAANFTGNLITAIQSNVTTLGTLTSVTVAGAATFNNGLTVSTGTVNLGAVSNLKITGAVSTNQFLTADTSGNCSWGTVVVPSVPTLVSSFTNDRGYYSSGNNVSFGTGAFSGAVSTGALTVTGAISATGDIIAFATSDARLKTDIKSIDNALDKVASLRGITYSWNEIGLNSFDVETVPPYLMEREVGLIAQEVQEVLPEVVVTRTNGYLAMRYERVVPLLVEAIKELREQVNELRKVTNNVPTLPTPDDDNQTQQGSGAF